MTNLERIEKKSLGWTTAKSPFHARIAIFGVGGLPAAWRHICRRFNGLVQLGVQLEPQLTRSERRALRNSQDIRRTARWRNNGFAIRFLHFFSRIGAAIT
jgi:hypothetical protein